jgi:hypothetical protein
MIFLDIMDNQECRCVKLIGIQRSNTKEHHTHNQWFQSTIKGKEIVAFNKQSQGDIYV